MSDEFSQMFSSTGGGATDVTALQSITPNIEFQLGKPIAQGNTCKHLHETKLFATEKYLANLKKLISKNCDIPLIIYGEKGIGKLTTTLSMMKYLADYMDNFPVDEKINILSHYKIYSNEWYRLMYLDNVFYLNLKLFLNDNEILDYLKYIYRTSKTISFDGKKKIFIIKHLDICSLQVQKYVAYILDHITANSSFILIVNSPFNLPRKIKSTCLKLHYHYLDESRFREIFIANYKCFFTDTELKQIAYMYKIYCNNNYNIGNTLSQIRYLKSAGKLAVSYLKNGENCESLMQMMVNCLVKKHIVLSGLERLMDVRRTLYTILSLNLSTIDFVRLICRKLVKSKISAACKLKILEKACEYSKVYKDANKLVIPLEGFIFEVIRIIYS